MTKPEIGEFINARYPGTCTRTGERYAAGTTIARDEFGYYIACIEDPGGDIRLSGGSGYGCDGWTPGQVVWHTPRDAEGNLQEPQVVVITRARSTYYREDGLSFGAGDDCGYVYAALARPATEEEAAPLLAERERQRAAYAKELALKKGLDTLFNHQVSTDANTPAGTCAVQGKRLSIGKGFTIYGTGQELAVDVDGQHVWFLMNNGMDGDNWALNNVRTGGAGAIGVRYPLTEERRSFLSEHWPDWAEEPAPAQDDDDDWETL